MQWSTAQLNTPRGNIAAVSLGVIATFAGGDDHSNVFDVVDIFDSSTGSWSVSNLSQARSFLGATTDGNVAVFAGGCYRDWFSSLATKWQQVPSSRLQRQLSCSQPGFV